MELIYTDASKTDVGVLAGAAATMAYGSGENALQIEVSRDMMPEGLAKGSLVYAQGTEWGGRVRKVRSDTANGTVTFGGPTWHGILASRVVRPDAGADYVTVSGDLNAAVLAVVRRCGLDGVFAVSTANSGITVASYSFDRFADAYSGLMKLCSKHGAKLKVKSESPKPVLFAERIADYSSDEFDATQIDIDAEIDYTPVNHLICAGSGELRDRTVVDLYADKAGNVSRTQTIFGEDLVEEFYDYPNADEDELVASGTERLKSYQAPRSGDLKLPASARYDVGDIVGKSDPVTGVRVVSPITKAILRMGDSCSVTYETGNAEVSQTGGIVAESSGGGTSYLPGYGIVIDGRTIKAEVGAADLAEVEDAARDAAIAASNASAAAGTAIKSVGGESPIAVETSAERGVSLRHAKSGVSAGAYGPMADAEPSWGDAVTVGARLSVDQTGHVAKAEGRSVRIPSSTATKDAKGLMSAADKRALDAYPWCSIDGKPDSYPPEAHEHRYAGSSAPGGSASSAEKLSTARKITFDGAVTGSVRFDGSEDVTVTLQGDGDAANFLAAHPVGSYYETENPENPKGAYGGTWSPVPGLGAYKWKRTS